MVEEEAGAVLDAPVEPTRGLVIDGDRPRARARTSQEEPEAREQTTVIFVPATATVSLSIDGREVPLSTAARDLLRPSG